MTEAFEVLDDARLEEARAIIGKYPNKHSAMRPLLQLVQSVEGYVTEAGMRDVARLLDVTPAHVLSSASFYTMFKKRPQGTYLISVCRNLSCTHMGGRKVMNAFEDRLGIGTGETTADGRFTLEAAECLATCDGAPSLQINYEDFYKVTPEQAGELVDRLERGDEVRSVRGEVVKTSREIARETALAGARLPGTAGDHSARLIGGETPRADTAPGFRPKQELDGGSDA
ncbi:MAG: NAD(P)H-dependent oxidoreductase subunit E [Actinomycetota bacterium]